MKTAESRFSSVNHLVVRFEAVLGCSELQISQDYMSGVLVRKVQLWCDLVHLAFHGVQLGVDVGDTPIVLLSGLQHTDRDAQQRQNVSRCSVCPTAIMLTKIESP